MTSWTYGFEQKGIRILSPRPRLKSCIKCSIKKRKVGSVEPIIPSVGGFVKKALLLIKSKFISKALKMFYFIGFDSNLLF